MVRTTDDNEGNGWEQYQKLVLSRLEEIRDTSHDTEERLRRIEMEIALLRLKSSLWGGVAGMGAFAATWLIQYISRKP
jgi:hypothetical protein